VQTAQQTLPYLPTWPCGYIAIRLFDYLCHALWNPYLEKACLIPTGCSDINVPIQVLGSRFTDENFVFQTLSPGTLLRLFLKGPSRTACKFNMNKPDIELMNEFMSSSFLSVGLSHSSIYSKHLYGSLSISYILYVQRHIEDHHIHRPNYIKVFISHRKSDSNQGHHIKAFQCPS
jgi:hypothetical protein